VALLEALKDKGYQGCENGGRLAQKIMEVVPAHFAEKTDAESRLAEMEHGEW